MKRAAGSGWGWNPTSATNLKEESVTEAAQVNEEYVTRVYAEFPIMEFFKYDHLPERLQDISRPFAHLAWQIVGWGIDIQKRGRMAERAVALRKLLEAKDAAVRSCL